jgi:flagellar biosynthesis protein FliQ
LAFVPKLVIFIVVLLLMSPWIIQRLTTYASGLYARLPQFG